MLNECFYRHNYNMPFKIKDGAEIFSFSIRRIKLSDYKLRGYGLLGDFLKILIDR